jgi:hypothetical protein
MDEPQLRRSSRKRQVADIYQESDGNIEPEASHVKSKQKARSSKDEKNVVQDDSADPEFSDNVAPSKKTSKRQKTAHAKRTAKLSSLPDFPLDILFYVCAMPAAVI